MKSCRRNIGAVKLYARSHSQITQWTLLVGWHWKPRPRLRTFLRLNNVHDDPKGSFPQELKDGQINGLLKVYERLIPYDDWLPILKCGIRPYFPDDDRLLHNIANMAIETR